MENAIAGSFLVSAEKQTTQRRLFFYRAGFSSGRPKGAGGPKFGVPSGFQVKRWIRGERKLLQPSSDSGLA